MPMAMFRLHVRVLFVDLCNVLPLHLNSRSIITIVIGD